MSLSHRIEKSPAPTPEVLIERAREMIPRLIRRAEADEREGRIDPDTIQEMTHAGFFRVLQSRRWGGYELGFDTFAKIQIELARGDLSVGLGLWRAGSTSLSSLSF